MHLIAHANDGQWGMEYHNKKIRTDVSVIEADLEQENKSARTS